MLAVERALPFWLKTHAHHRCYKELFVDLNSTKKKRLLELKEVALSFLQSQQQNDNSINFYNNKH